MWDVKNSDEYTRRLKRYLKKRPKETKFALANLESFLDALNTGTRPEDIRVGFVHPEPCGVLAITEKGVGKGSIPLRLYIYPDAKGECLYLVTLGDKESQAADILFCKKSMEFLRMEGQAPDVQ